MPVVEVSETLTSSQFQVAFCVPAAVPPVSEHELPLDSTAPVDELSS